MSPIGIYIHVPFCISRCYYCDFYSTTDLRVEYVKDYVDAVIESLQARSVHFEGLAVQTIYFGGGTPAILGRHLVDIIDAIHECYYVADNVEITIEANPGSLSPDIVNEWVGSGVSRISLGVQAFDPAVLKAIGRSHTVDDTMRSLAFLDEVDVAVSIDLMCGLPQQDLGKWRAQIDMAIACEPDHISVYPLTVEEGTAMHTMVNDGSLTIPEPDEVAEQMDVADHALQSAGYEHYEIANYAKPGKRSRHNVGYWSAIPYLGIGPSAASMLTNKDGSRRRGIAHSTIESFIADPILMDTHKWSEYEELTPQEARCEDLMLGMRMMEGVESFEVGANGLEEVFESLCSKGLVEFDEENERYRPTDIGWLLGNEIFGEIWSAREMISLDR